MAFVFTWASKAFSNGPIKQQHFSYTMLHTDLTASVVPPSFGDRIDYVLIDGVCRTAADTMSGLTGTLTVLNPTNATYTVTCSSASATVGAIYSAANGQQFVVNATIASALSLSANADVGATALAASGTLTKISGTGDSTITYSAMTIPTFYGTGIAFGI